MPAAGYGQDLWDVLMEVDCTAKDTSRVLGGEKTFCEGGFWKTTMKQDTKDLESPKRGN